MYCIALICTRIEAGVRRQHAICYIQRLVIAQHRCGEAAALHLRQLVNQHVAHSHNLAFKAEPAAEQKRLAESSAVGEFGEVQLNAFNADQRHLAWIVRISDFDVF